MHGRLMLLDKDGIAIGFDEIYDRHFDEIFRYVLRRTARVAEAEDLTAQVFFHALRDGSRHPRRKLNIPAWLFRIATNEVNAYFRTAKRRPTTALLVEEGAEVQATEMARAEEAMMELSHFRMLNAALRTLKPEDQTLIALRFFEDKPFEEIAAIVGKRVGAVTMRTRRALETLRTELTRRGVDHERFGERATRTREGADQAGFRRSDLPAKSAP